MPSNRMKLTDDNVWQVYNKCIYNQDEQKNEESSDTISVQGIKRLYIFSLANLCEERKHILSLLSQVTRRSRYGASMTQLCYNRREQVWTKNALTMEALMCLGLAIGKVKYLLPKESWSLLKNQMPYVIIR